MKRLSRLLLSALLVLAPISAQTEDMTRVDVSTTERIDRHNVCRSVTNNTGEPVMIPHASPQEWSVGLSAFLSNPYPNLIVSPCPATTVYDVGTCAIGATGNPSQPLSTACGPSYVASLDMPVSFQTGECRADGQARLHRIINQNYPATFWHGYLCQEAPPGRPGHVYLGEFQSTSTQLRDLLVGGTLHVVSNTVTMNGLSGEAVLTWAHGGNARGSAIRINKGAWVTSTSADPALRRVRNGDQVELAMRTGGGTTSSRNWAILTMTSVTNPSLSLRRDFAVTGDRTVSTSPYPEPPLTSGGAISSSSSNHPVFSMFQSCFGVGPGAHLSFPGACTMDAAFWDRFYTEACKASPYSLSISMGGLNLASSGSACAVTGFETFQSRARVSTCVPDSCAIGEGGGPAACVFSCN